MTYRALGAEAVTLSIRQMASRPDALIDGLDIQPEALAGWRLRGSITFNVNLWPRTLALVAGRTTYEWLEAAEREMLHEAASGDARTDARSPGRPGATRPRSAASGRDCDLRRR